MLTNTVFETRESLSRQHLSTECFKMTTYGVNWRNQILTLWLSKDPTVVRFVLIYGWSWNQLICNPPTEWHSEVFKLFQQMHIIDDFIINFHL